MIDSMDALNAGCFCVSLDEASYQGQNPNFRTTGGGFAPVYRAPGKALALLASAQASCSDQSVFCQAETSSRSR